MKTFLVLLLYRMTSVTKLLGPGGARAVKHQLLILNRSRRRAPNLSTLDRMLLGFWSLFLSLSRIHYVDVIVRPTTLQRFRDALKKRKCGRLFPLVESGDQALRILSQTKPESKCRVEYYS